eukprot:6291379-Pyramimonas_sp.AAC.1
MIVLLSDGGNGKSAKSKLRASVFGQSCKYVGSSCFQVEEEFREQGCHFAQARCLIMSECTAGKPLQESVVENFVSGA